MAVLTSAARDVMDNRFNDVIGQGLNQSFGPASPDGTAAAITRGQWQHFLDMYRPVEEEALARAMQTDFSAEGDEAGITAGQAAGASRGTLARNLSRAGTALTSEERTAVGRRQGMSLARAVGRAENTTRRTLADTRTDLLANLVSIGRGVSQTASGGMQSVADMAAMREQQYKAQKAATSSTNISMGLGAAALLLAI